MTSRDPKGQGRDPIILDYYPIIQQHIDTVNVMRAISPFYDFCCFWCV